MMDQTLLDAYYQLGRLSSKALDEEKYHDAFRYAIAAYSVIPELRRTYEK